MPTLHICTTCRTGLPLAEGATAPGQFMFDAVAALAGPDVTLAPVKCLSSCDNGCAAAISAPGKWTYLLGRLDPSMAPDLLTYAATYAAHPTGTVLPSRRPASLAKMISGPHAGPRARTGRRMIPATVITGFLGAGKTTLLRHLVEHAGGRRLALIVNEFGTIGVDAETMRGCGIPSCEEADIVELANGCLCCTVADEFLPAMQALLDRPNPPDHIVIETSGLALPKPLLKAFNWPGIKERVTVDGVITVVDGPAVAAGRFADDPVAVAKQRAEDPGLDHDNPLAEVYEDQLNCADLVVLSKTDLLDADAIAALHASIGGSLPRAVRILDARHGRLDPAILLGLEAAAEDDLAARPSCHDAEDGAHEHDDFDSFVVAMPEIASPEALLARLRAAAEAHDVLRMKGFVAVTGKPMRLAIQGVGTRFSQGFDRPWRPGEARTGHLVVIGQTGMDRAALAAAIGAAGG